MTKLTFRPLTHDEFSIHRGTCPLEIGRFQTVGENVRKLIGPLPIYKIWTQNDKRDRIWVSLNQKTKEESDTETLYGPIKIVLGSDDVLYRENNGVYESITRIIEYP